jgi:predicted esterase YcpF (UPF0227 family)
MSAEAAVDLRVRTRPSRMECEAAEVEAAIALVAGRSDYRVLLCGLRYGGQLAASLTLRAAAAGVRLEPMPRIRNAIDIRVCRA